jgi:hypothetical protein
VRCRIRGKQSEGSWQLLAPPVVEYKETYQPGVMVETRQGFPVPAGTVRFSKGARLYTDGSADHPGTAFATASCSVVEKAAGKPELAVQVALPPDWPQSAVAAEMYAIMVALHILSRGDEFGEPHVAGSITLVVDCEAVCKASRWSLPQLVHEKFIFASCWHGFLDGPVGGICKVAAHRTRQEAQAEGWEVDWVGNDTADELAKDARPSVVGHGRKWVAELRQASRLLEVATAVVPAGFLSRAFGIGHSGRAGKVPRAPRPPLVTHTVSFVAGRWACSACGAACRRPNGVAAFRAAECSGRNRLLDSVHFSHRLQAGWLGEGGLVPGAHGQFPFAICTDCGYFSTSRVVGLARACTRHATAGRRRGIVRVERGLHPVKAVHEVLLGLKAASGRAGRCGPGVPPGSAMPAGGVAFASLPVVAPGAASALGMGAGVSSICDGAARAACKKDRPPAIPPPGLGVQVQAGSGAAQSLSGCSDGWQAAGSSSLGGSSESCGVAQTLVWNRPPAIRSSPDVGPGDPFFEVGSCGPGLGEDGLHDLTFTSGAQVAPCMWCDFCGLPFMRSVRETVSCLTGDTAAGEVGPLAASVAVCECGGGFA